MCLKFYKIPKVRGAYMRNDVDRDALKLKDEEIKILRERYFA